MNTWKRTWRDTVERFLNEMRGSDEDVRRDAMSDALHETRDRLREAEAQLDDAEARATEEQSAAADCVRRGEMAAKIGDEETAQVAARFAERHSQRARVLLRKREVLVEEVRLLRSDLDEMLAAYGERGEQGEDTPAVDAGAAEVAAAEREAERAADPRDDPLRTEIDRLDERQRERAADARLEELKRRARGAGPD